MLTEHAVGNSKPKPKPYKLADFAGLYLLVQPNGSKWWRLKYRLQGVEKCISLGIHPGVSLALARQRRDHVRAQLRSGVDPGAKAKTSYCLLCGPSNFNDFSRPWVTSRDAADKFETINGFI